ncbi:MAG: cyclic nucleotide-binding domain-containing protein [Alicyclobacillus sp.]|nr:cyclic nucleotide-binding domain-containing protein [Alicyclobacillus sp.]
MNLSAFQNDARDDERVHEPSVPFMKHRSADDWAALLAFTRSTLFQAGQTILEYGDTDRTLHIVLGGQLEVWVPGATGDARLAARIQAGSVFGEQAFLDGRPRSATVRALTDGELRSLHWTAFTRLAEERPSLAHGILFDIGCILSERLRRMNALFP